MLIMAAVYFMKNWLFQWFLKHGLFTVYVPPNTEYSSALCMNHDVVNFLFWYEAGNFLLCVGLINSLEPATGLLSRVVKFLAYLLAALYTLAMAVSFLPALLPRLILFG